MIEPNLSRRAMLQTASCGFGLTAMQGLVGSNACASTNKLGTKKPPLPVRARRVIFLFMSGGPAHLDTFDYKPQTGKKPHAGSAFEFSQHGESG